MALVALSCAFSASKSSVSGAGAAVGAATGGGVAGARGAATRGAGGGVAGATGVATGCGVAGGILGAPAVVSAEAAVLFAAEGTVRQVVDRRVVDLRHPGLHALGETVAPLDIAREDSRGQAV